MEEVNERTTTIIWNTQNIYKQIDKQEAHTEHNVKIIHSPFMAGHIEQKEW